MIEVFEIDRGQRDHSTSGGSLGYLYTIVALRIYIYQWITDLAVAQSLRINLRAGLAQTFQCSWRGG